MEDRALASPSRIERTLELACAYNAPLSIHAESGDDIYRYKSRMLDMRKARGSRSLVIDQPASRRKISALEISYPNVLKSGQRRAYFRVPIPLRAPIDVDCTVVGEVAGKAVENEDAGNALLRPRLRGRTINISVGGMLIVLEEGATDLADVGTKLALQFSLEKNETPIRLSAIIRRLEKKSATDQFRMGIEFVDIDVTFENKLAVNRLYRYVAERQREIIQSGSK